MIMGILITHNHSDHIKGLEVFVRKNHIPAFTTRNIWKSILSPHLQVSRDCIHEISLHRKFHLAGFDIEAFPVFHDAPETIGFQISAEGKNITIATDLGHICETSARYIKSANVLVIESNYDEEMLLNGMYPRFLQSRIMSDNGHLGNHQTSAFLAENISGGLTDIFLAHLSKNNNTPETALYTLNRHLAERGISISCLPRISVLDRDLPGEMIKLK
jgi:phosphoribosyl 1,2-cyclic phosphodiesterase